MDINHLSLNEKLLLEKEISNYHDYMITEHHRILIDIFHAIKGSSSYLAILTNNKTQFELELK